MKRISRILFLPIAILFLTSACKDMVIPHSPERLAELQKQYDVMVKECAGPTLRLRIFMEEKLGRTEGLWNKNALLGITFLSAGDSFTIVFHSELSKDESGKTIGRTFFEIFLVESVISEKDLMPFPLKIIKALAYRQAYEKLFRIYPERDITMGEYSALTNSYYTAYENLVNTCLHGF